MSISKHELLTRVPQAYCPPAIPKLEYDIARVAVALASKQFDLAIRIGANDILPNTTFVEDVRDGILCYRRPGNKHFELVVKEGQRFYEPWMSSMGHRDWEDTKALGVHLLTSTKFGAAAWSWTLGISKSSQRAVTSAYRDIDLPRLPDTLGDMLKWETKQWCYERVRTSVYGVTNVYTTLTKQDIKNIENTPSLRFEKVFPLHLFKKALANCFVYESEFEHNQKKNHLPMECYIPLLRAYHEEAIKTAMSQIKSTRRLDFYGTCFGSDDSRVRRERTFLDDNIHTFASLYNGLEGTLHKMKENVEEFNALKGKPTRHRGAKLTKGLKFTIDLREKGLCIDDGEPPVCLMGKYSINMSLGGCVQVIWEDSLVSRDAWPDMKGKDIYVRGPRTFLEIESNGCASVPPLTDVGITYFDVDIPGILRLLHHIQRGNMASVAKNMGGITGCCMFCSSNLTDPKSINLGVGPICLANYGNGFDVNVAGDAAIRRHEARDVDMRDDTQDGMKKIVEMMRSSSSLGKYVMENTENGQVILDLVDEHDDQIMQWAEKMCRYDNLTSFEVAVSDYAHSIASDGKWLPVDGEGFNRLFDMATLCVHFKHEKVDAAISKYIQEMFPLEEVNKSIRKDKEYLMGVINEGCVDAKGNHLEDMRLSKRAKMV